MGGFHVIGHEGKSESLVLSSLFLFFVVVVVVAWPSSECSIFTL